MDKSVKFRIELETNGEKVLHTLSVNTEDFKKAIGDAVNETQHLSTAISSLTEGAVLLSSLNSIMSQLCSSVGSLANDFNTFDKSMRAVNTMAGKDSAGMAELKGQVEELADVIPLAKDELANGLYQVISNGVPEDNWIEFLNKSARSSVGGIADLGQTVTVTSTIIKNYGMEWSAAGEIQDKIQMTAKNGVTSFEQLAAALPRVTGNAATLGVSIDELMATFATLTGVSGNTAEVSTQLAAVFTALVKPSSEATQMAQQMGIQFDAAAIKAAGGMENFLTKLTRDIQQYAAAHGMLEQEIYGKLFGSAESIRALIPLTGELADKFSENVQAMADSEGTIDAAFESMAGSGENVAQVLKNQMSTMLDWAGSVASSIQPYLTFVAVGGQAVAGLTMLVGATKKAIAATIALAAAQKKGAIASALAAMHEKIGTLALNLLTASSVTATAGTWALTAAVTALYAALTLGISAVITGIVALFTSMGDEAEDTAEKVDVLKQSTDAFKNTTSDAKAEIDMELVSLSNLIRQHGDATNKVEELNRKYGEALGYHKSAAEWYDTLVQKSQAYCQQLGYEAQAKILASQIAAKEMEYQDKLQRMSFLGQQYWDKNGKIHYNYEKVSGGKEEYDNLRNELGELYSDIDKCKSRYETCINKMLEAQNELSKAVNATTKEVDWQTMSYADLGKAIETQKAKVASLAGVDATEAKKQSAILKQMEARYKSLGKAYGLTTETNTHKNEFDGKKLIINAESYKALGNNITYYQNQLEKTAPSETETIRLLTEKINKLKEAQAAIKQMMDEAGRPTELNTIENINKEIAYQQALRGKATSENIAGIDAEIKRLNALKTALEENSHIVLAANQIHTYEELEEQLSFYEKKLKRVSETERVEIQLQINELRKLKKAWDETLDELEKPADISRLNSIEKLDDAISYYQNKQKKASASEIEDIQRVIDALQRKRDAINRLTEIPAMQMEIADLGKLGGKKLTMELELVGLEGIKTKIRSLQKMLNDVKNPLNADQRREVEKLIGSWKDYEKQLKKSQIKMTDAWGSIKGIGNGIQSMSEALKGNGNAWETVVAVVDSAIQIYEGVSSIIKIIETLTAVTNTTTAATTASATASTTAATAKVAAAPEEVAAATAVTAATKIEAMAYRELAASEFMAAHAYIPFAGAGIAAGFIATMQAIVASVAVTPFANGGLVYGPTLALMGEYSGASSNPEVIAPLDKLRSLLGETNGGGLDGKVEFKMKGRRLVGVLEREYNHRKRNS